MYTAPDEGLIVTKKNFKYIQKAQLLMWSNHDVVFCDDGPLYDLQHIPNKFMG